jgi:hypothetical protein
MSERVQLINVERDGLIKALRHLEVIVPSLARIGSFIRDVPDEEQHRVLAEFLLDWSIGPRLADVRELLSNAFDYEELERLVGNVEIWSSDNRKPKNQLVVD